MWVNVDRYGTMTPREMPFDWVPPPPEIPELLEPDTTTAGAVDDPAESGTPMSSPAAIPITTAVVPVTPASASP
jgi:hypothetical protein